MMVLLLIFKALKLPVKSADTIVINKNFKKSGLVNDKSSQMNYHNLLDELT